MWGPQVPSGAGVQVPQQGWPQQGWAGQPGEPQPGWPQHGSPQHGWPTQQAWQQQGWVQQQPWTPPARVPTRLATAVVAALVVGAVVDAVAAVLGLRYGAAIGGVLDGTGSMLPVRAVEDGYVGAGVVQLLAFVTTVVLFLVWFSKVDAVARTFGVVGHRHGHGWAVGAWFVPFLNLWRPKQLADDAWRAADPALPPGAHLTAAPQPGLVRLWWGLWVIANVLSGTSITFSTELEDLRQSAHLGAVADLLFVVSAITAVLVVRQLTARASAAAAARGR